MLYPQDFTKLIHIHNLIHTFTHTNTQTQMPESYIARLMKRPTGIELSLKKKIDMKKAEIYTDR